jgi:autophagy-related protein 5
MTLISYLHQVLPLLFIPPSPDEAEKAEEPINLASILLHGIMLPLETELNWLAMRMAGADGWLNFIVVVDRS